MFFAEAIPIITIWIIANIIINEKIRLKFFFIVVVKLKSVSLSVCLLSFVFCLGSPSNKGAKTFSLEL